MTGATITGQISVKSGNRKTGPIPTTSRGLQTCPSDCPFRPDGEIGGCYGTGRIFGMADKYTRPHDVDTLTAQLRKTADTRRMILRDRVVGDIATEDGGVDRQWLVDITALAGSVGRRPFGYTHHRGVTADDVPDGYTLNASCETPDDVRDAHRRGLPAVMAGDDVPDVIDGARVVTCPATQRDDVDCSTCGLCAMASRMSSPETAPVIHFPLHGTAVKRARRAVAARNA